MIKFKTFLLLAIITVKLSGQSYGNSFGLNHEIWLDNYGGSEKNDKYNFKTYFMPGLSYTFYQPKLFDSTGNFSGVTIEYLIFAKAAQSDEPGPSHLRFYSKLNILKSDKGNINPLFMYTAGLDMSLEKNPKRLFMIPYFGLEFGGISQKQFGNTLQFTPILGVHLLSRKNLFVNIHGGYIYAISNFEIYQGWFAQAGLNFSLW